MFVYIVSVYIFCKLIILSDVYDAVTAWSMLCSDAHIWGPFYMDK